MTLGRGTRRTDGERGAAAVEFALILPVFLLILFGTIDFARAYNNRVSLTGAAREGVRVLALGTGDPVATTRAAAPSITPASSINVTTTACANPGDPARVTASLNFNFLTPVSPIAQILGGTTIPTTYTLTGIGVMRCGG